MSFCPVCKANHDPRMPCFSRTEEILWEADIHPKRQMSQKEFKATVHKANRSLVALLIILGAAVPLGILIGAIIGKIKHMVH